MNGDSSHLLSRDQFLHRGMSMGSDVQTPEDVHNNLFAGPMRVKDGKIVSSSGPVVGTHWSTNYEVASGFAGWRTRNGTGVVLHATHPGDSARMSEAEQAHTDVIPQEEGAYDAEHEFPVASGTPMHVHGITIRGNRNGESKHFAVDWHLPA